MAEEEWIQLFNLHEGKMIYNAIQMQKQDWEQTDVIKHCNVYKARILKFIVRYLPSIGLDRNSYRGHPHYRI